MTTNNLLNLCRFTSELTPGSIPRHVLAHAKLVLLDTLGVVLAGSKSEEAVARVRSINPGVEVTPHQAKIDASNAGEILAGSDVVVDALDNVPTRFALERETKALKIPLVHGAVAGFEGRMMTIFPEDPGLKTLYGDEPVEVDDTKRPEAIMGVPVLTPSFIANLQAMEAVKIILKRGKLFRNIMLHVDLEGGQVSEFSFQKSNS